MKSYNLSICLTWISNSITQLLTQIKLIDFMNPNAIMITEKNMALTFNKTSRL
jgi:hypothetical protein